jgi:hypothetical protein
MNHRTKLPRPGSRCRSNCRKCGVNIYDISEYYMLHAELWQSVVDRWKMPIDEYGHAGMLCIRCFENLLGWTLTAEDFTDCPANDENRITGSDRLRHRLDTRLPE